MTQFVIKRGKKENLDKLVEQNRLVDGAWYVTTDTQQVYVCIGAALTELTSGDFDAEIEAIASLGGTKEVEIASKRDLPNIGTLGHVYKCVDSGMRYKWNGEYYDCVAIPADKVVADVKVITGGDAATEIKL